MKQAVLLSTLPAALALFSPASLDATSLDTAALNISVPTPPSSANPDIILTRFTRSIWGGPGCPVRESASEPRTQMFRIGDDGRLEYDFTSLYASTGELRSLDETGCMVVVSIDGIPEGWAFRFTDVWVRGYAALAEGTAARINAAVSLGDEEGLQGEAQLSNLGPSDGSPVSTRFMAELLEVAPEDRALAMTPCVSGGPRLGELTLTLSLEVLSQVVPVAEGAVGVEAVEVGGTLWECD